jgi:hypothetical protein
MRSPVQLQSALTDMDANLIDQPGSFRLSDCRSNFVGCPERYGLIRGSARRMGVEHRILSDNFIFSIRMEEGWFGERRVFSGFL